jgi:hypothetical protein
VSFSRSGEDPDVEHAVKTPKVDKAAARAAAALLPWFGVDDCRVVIEVLSFFSRLFRHL